MSKVKVRKADAEKVLAAVTKRFGPGAELIKDWDWLGHGPTPYAIVWEEGPYEWAYAFTGDDTTDEERILAAEFSMTVAPPKPAKIPAAVYCEPITTWAVGLYDSGYAQ